MMDAIPPRRLALTELVEHNGKRYAVTFGIVENKVRECFCSVVESTPNGTELHAIASDACIAISKLLRRGETLPELAASLGENRPEGALTGPPSSLLGAIVRAGLPLQTELRA